MTSLLDRLPPTLLRIVLALYGVWALAVLALVGYQVTGAAVPPVVHRTVVAGTLVAVVVGAGMYVRDGIDYLTG